MQCAILSVLVAFALAACEMGSAHGGPQRLAVEPASSLAGSRAPQLAAGSGSDASRQIPLPGQVCPAIGPPPNCIFSTCPTGRNCHAYFTCGGGTLWCCDSKPSCDPGDVELAMSACPGDIPCYQKELCGTQIACLDTERVTHEDAGIEDAGTE